ncbi:MAG: phosphoglucosamine mutase [Oscillospiraceae bacterium]|nr:phosphoglucosamine mutase [Oscillospiraceae bacterium]
MEKLFGTDGIRGIANKELTCELAMNAARATAVVLADNKGKGQSPQKRRTKILVGKDTRLSCDMLEGALVAGLCSAGVDTVLLGVLPTPAVAFLTKKYEADAGIMISASHNPYNFNGIKIFEGNGYKLSDEMEFKIEEAVAYTKKISLKSQNLAGSEGRVFFKKNALRDYIDHIKKSVGFSLDGPKVAFDCSNGAASYSAKILFEELNCQCKMLFCHPNGVNINKDCGSIYLENLSNFVKNNDVDLGIAFDGDADRCLAVDENGDIVDGDAIMAMCAADMKSRGKLSKNTVVGTIMTNLGFVRFCDKNEINFIPAEVGDKYVLREMLREDFNLGGEQSGHVIFKDFATTGDGQLTAGILLGVINKRRQKLSKLTEVLKKFPQASINIEASREQKLRVKNDKNLLAIIKEAQQKLGDAGRIIVRPSGTEPFIRVMMEWENSCEIDNFLNKFALEIKKKLANT